MSSTLRHRDLVIGTHNRKKGAELAEMLAPWGVAVVTLDDVPGAIDVAEEGDSFAANARRKASEQARHLGRWVLADDSGLEVDALGGAPGVYSARFAERHPLPVPGEGLAEGGEARPSPGPSPGPGEGNVDAVNNRYLLQILADTPLAKRTARYVCHVALADPTGAIRAESHDVCRGRIRFEPAGTHGFGYDPLFEVVEYHRTFGQLGPSVKRAISHRSRAMRAILPELRKAWSSEQRAKSKEQGARG
jgi:XTP/dITP diphosphohydrolase